MSISEAKRGRNPRGGGIPINHRGRIAGYFYPETQTHTRRWSRAHLVRAFNGIAYSSEVIDELARRGCKVLQNTNDETGAVYRVGLAEFMAEAQPFNFGHGDQLALPLAFWSVTVSGQEHPCANPVKTAPAWMQAGLFEVAS